MQLVSRDRLAAACRAADRSAVTDMVAALYDARGYEVESPAEGRLTLQPGEEAVAVCPAVPSEVSAETDVLVTVDGGTASTGDDAPDVVDTSALHEQLHYAVDRAAARDLLAAHLGIDAVTDGPGSTGDTEREGSKDRHSGRDASGGQPAVAGQDREAAQGRWLPAAGAVPDTLRVPARLRRRGAPDRHLLATVAVVAVVTGALLGLVFLPPGSGTRGSTGVGSVTETATPAGTATQPAGDDRNGEAIAAARTLATETPARSLTAAVQQPDDRYPPGVDESGLADYERLVAAHRASLAEGSYTLTVQYRESEDGRVTGTYVETIRVESRRRYSVSVSAAGAFETSPRAIVGADAFSDENRTWVRLRSTEPFARSRLSTARVLDQTARYLRWSLSAEESTLGERVREENRTVYRVTTAGDPYPGIRDANGTVYVTDDGLIRYGQWDYVTASDGTRVEFAVRTSEVGTTRVSRPPWAEQGGNADADARGERDRNDDGAS